VSTRTRALAGTVSTRTRALLGVSSLQRTAVLLAVALALTPFWPVPVTGLSWLTVGRALLLLVAAMAAIEVISARLGALPLARHSAVLIVGLAALVAWTGASAMSRGCFCSGGFGGLAEWSMLTALTALVAVLSPGYRTLLLGSAAAGVTLGGLLAAIGVGDLAASVADTSVGDRLGGIYGNPNVLGFAVAFAVPILIAGALGAGWKRRLPLLVALVGVSTVIVLTL
jgi:hypothetical protein